MHADMGPHNIIVSSETHTEIQAVINWEFVASAPYASLHRIIEISLTGSAGTRAKRHKRSSSGSGSACS
jgi:hypothetical protein